MDLYGRPSPVAVRALSREASGNSFERGATADHPSWRIFHRSCVGPGRDRTAVWSGRGDDLDDPTRMDPEVPDVDAWRVHPERRERGADLAPMVGPVVQRL